MLQVIALQLTVCQSGGGGGGGGGPSTFGYDASSACSKPYSRAGRAHHDLPCDFHRQNWCTIAGSSYPWYFVHLRFVLVIAPSNWYSSNFRRSVYFRMSVSPSSARIADSAQWRGESLGPPTSAVAVQSTDTWIEVDRTSPICNSNVKFESDDENDYPDLFLSPFFVFCFVSACELRDDFALTQILKSHINNFAKDFCQFFFEYSRPGWATLLALDVAGPSWLLGSISSYTNLKIRI